MIRNEKNKIKRKRIRKTIKVCIYQKHHTPGEDKIDAILDKISQSGMESITPKERETLEKFTKGISIDDEDRHLKKML